MKKKICHVLTSLNFGGAAESTLTRIKSLATAYDFSVIAGKSMGGFNSLEASLKSQGVRFFVSEHLSNSLNPIVTALSFAELYFFFRKNHFDAVHTHNTVAGILGRIAARLAGVKKIFHEVHGLPVTKNPIILSAYFFLERALAVHTTAYFIVSQKLCPEFSASFSVPREKIVFLPSAIDDKIPHLGKTRRLLALRRGERAIGMIARLDWLKRQDLFLDISEIVLKKTNNVRFFLVGEGQFRKKIEREIFLKNLGKHVEITGFVEQDDVWRIVGELDIVLHTSEKEAIPRAIVQAMLLEKPVVCFDVGNINEIVINGETGFLVPFAENEKAAEIILDLLRKPVLRKKIGKQAKKQISKIFDLRHGNILLSKFYAR